MSDAGRKKLERLVKKATKELCTDPELQSPSKRKKWYDGTQRLMAELRNRKDAR